MSRTVFYGRGFRVTHTVNEEGAPYSIPWHHYEDSLCVTCMLSGSGTCTIEENEYILSAGAILVIAADKSRFFQFEGEGLHERISFYFSDELLHLLAEQKRDFLQFVPKPSSVGMVLGAEDYDREKADLILEQVKTLLSAKTEEKLLELAVEMLSLIRDVKDCALHSLNLQQQDDVTRAICKYIDGHLRENLSYKRLQKLFFVSRYHLGTKFPQQTGKTLTEYVIFKRLLRSCELARDGTGIEDAAYQCGFNTYSHFYKEFVKNFGIPPRAYLGK